MSAIDTGNTAWMLISTALVMLMTPGLAFFYGGMVSRKNALSTIMMSFMTSGLDRCVSGFFTAIAWPLAPMWAGSSVI